MNEFQRVGHSFGPCFFFSGWSWRCFFLLLWTIRFFLSRGIWWKKTTKTMVPPLRMLHFQCPLPGVPRLDGPESRSKPNVNCVKSLLPIEKPSCHRWENQRFNEPEYNNNQVGLSQSTLRYHCNQIIHNFACKRIFTPWHSSFYYQHSWGSFYVGIVWQLKTSNSDLQNDEQCDQVATTMACFACNCYPNLFSWFLLFNGSIDVPQQTTSTYANQHLKSKEVTRRKHHKFILLSLIPTSGCLFPIQIYLFLGWTMRSFIQKHAHKRIRFTLYKELQCFFPQTAAGFPNISLFFLSAAKMQSTPRILRLRKRCWATLPSCSPGFQVTMATANASAVKTNCEYQKIHPCWHV